MRQLSLDFDDTWADELIEWAINQQVPEYSYVEDEHDEDGVLLSRGYWIGLPRDKSVLVDLEELNLNGYLSTGIPEQIRFLERLKILRLADGVQASWGPEDFDKEPYCVSEMPWWLPNLKNLEVLDLSGDIVNSGVRHQAAFLSD